MSVLEKQVIYGVGNDANGFAGLHDNAQLDAVDDTMVIECATPGSTASSQTSVYILRHGQDDCSFILGNDGRIVVEDEPTIIQKAGASTDRSYYPALFVPVTGYAGFQIGGAYSAARICNIETALTDDDIYDALALFPASRQPNAIVMNRDAMKLLRKSRTATNPSGDPAPRPTEVDGIPIIVTDSVKSTEAVET